MGLVHHPNVVSDGLIGCWDAGNRRSYPGAGTTWTDLAGDVKGTLINEDDDALNFNSFKGGYFGFDGTDGYVDMGSSNQILPGGRNPFTISLWLKPDSQGDTQEGLYSFNQPDDDQEGSTTYAFGILWEPSASGETYAFYAGQRGLTTWGPSKASGASREDWVDTWCCITITYNGEGTKSGHANYRFYINDVNYALSDISGWGGTVNFNRLGNVTTVTTHAYDGYMANISIYNRALSADEVSQNYEALKPRFEPRITKSGLVGNWDAGDPESYVGGTTWKDTANGNVGTLENLAAGQEFSAANGGSIVFDGTDSWMTTSFSSLFDFTGSGKSMTVAAWAKCTGTISDWTTIASDQVDASTSSWLLEIHNSKAEFYWYAGGNHTINTNSILSSDTWYYIVGTYDAAALRIYLNAELEDTNAQTGANTRAGGKVGIGGWYQTTYQPFDGNIASVRLYNRALSDAEIMDNFQKTRGRFGV